MINCVVAYFSIIIFLTANSPGYAAEPSAPAGVSALTTGAASQADFLKPGTRPYQSRQAVAHELIDINTATLDQLTAISGIGDSYAGKIVAGRPYANKAQLKSRRIVPENVYELIKTKIIARQVKRDVKDSGTAAQKSY